MATCCVRVLRRLRAAAPALPPEPFISTKLTNKLHQQLQEPLTLAAAATPHWSVLCCLRIPAFSFTGYVPATMTREGFNVYVLINPVENNESF